VTAREFVPVVPVNKEKEEDLFENSPEKQKTRLDLQRSGVSFPCRDRV
jgi:hypothetical protein